MDLPEPQRVDKGKGRAVAASETTPLLASGSVSSSRNPSVEPPHAARRRLYSRLLSVFLVTLSFCIFLFAVLAIIAYSWRSRASDTHPEEIIKRALVVRGPDRVEVLNATSEDGVWLMVHGRMGVDAGGAMGFKADDDDTVGRDWWKCIGRWGIRTLDRVTVTLSPIQVASRAHPNITLVTISAPPLEVILTANPPQDISWLTPVHIPVRIQPTPDTDAIVHFLKDSWRTGFMSLQGLVAHAKVRGGGLHDHGWRSQLVFEHADVRPIVNMKVPSLPGLPKPGKNNPFPEFRELVTLKGFEIASVDGTIILEANATAINPLPMDLMFEAPALPFMISLPSSTPSTPSVTVAAVHSLPFTLTRPNITFSIAGGVVPLPRNSSGALSQFVSDYIQGRDADIQITSPLAPGLVVNTTFPAPHPRPQILRNVTLKDMKIRPVGTAMYASGVVHALVVLPHGINVGVNASRVFPDVLVYDGAVSEPTEGDPDGDRDEELLSDPPPTRPLPDPLPPRAFAHIVPEDWLPANCEPIGRVPNAGSAVAVTAKIEDVPLKVLPGREREFSDFVGKVIFGTQGALAGVQGVAAVAVRVDGLPFANGNDGEMELSGLPFQGSVRIGKKSGLGHF
ncbi:uncharacterized protein BXZ73DRAFT_89597 [Epithele typhae]|uniref:uncharacterized protein n=1 Tax=Epithele typhae TaxID=378194 RepID=UPI0020074A60|nr:uncharacterized protein BXZ73DRAFT_89597 [Epithele typhae]KAH9934536.1 hypothetical protein BXZ73DRAFT_89597 [Epithele typhae]